MMYKSTLRISNKLKKRLERFLRRWPQVEEYGGFLIESQISKRVNDFLPILNMSNNPREKFDPLNRTRALDLAKKYARSKKAEPVAFWHSHPDPCIMSTGDLGYASYYNDLIFVTISPIKDSGWPKRFIWYACMGVKPIEIVFE